MRERSPVTAVAVAVAALAVFAPPAPAGPGEPNRPTTATLVKGVPAAAPPPMLLPLPADAPQTAPPSRPAKPRRQAAPTPLAGIRQRQRNAAVPPPLAGLKRRELATVRLVAALEGRRERTPQATLVLVRQAIQEGADPNAADREGVTPLLWAVFHYQNGRAYDLDLVRVLLKRGANPDAMIRVYGSGRPLMRAADRGWTDVVQALLDAPRPARTDVVDADDRTALHLAVRRGHVETAKRLIAAGSPLSRRDEDGRTPLHTAALAGNAELVRALLDAGADDAIADVDGKTPLFLAVTNRRADAAVPLIASRTAPLKSGDEFGNTPLHYAAKAGDLTMLRAFVAAYRERLTTLDEHNRELCTPLYLAAEAGHLEAARLLVAGGASAFERGRGGMRPHEVARARDNREVALYLREVAGEKD